MIAVTTFGINPWERWQVSCPTLLWGHVWRLKVVELNLQKKNPKPFSIFYDENDIARKDIMAKSYTQIKKNSDNYTSTNWFAKNNLFSLFINANEMVHEPPPSL